MFDDVLLESNDRKEFARSYIRDVFGLVSRPFTITVVFSSFLRIDPCDLYVILVLVLVSLHLCALVVVEKLLVLEVR